jgi:aminoglycoside phosphotransferase (APT) family kinase protein
LVGRLQDALPRQCATGIVHGDYRIDNALLRFADDGTEAVEVAAVLDWELSTIGDPVADVASMCSYRHPAFDLVIGTSAAWTSDLLPDVRALAAAYEHAGGVELIDFESHLALAYLKIAVISAGIDHRLRAGAGTDAAFATAGGAVAPFIEAGLDLT